RRELVILETAAHADLVGSRGPPGDVQALAVLVRPAPRHLVEAGALPQHAGRGRRPLLLRARPVLHPVTTTQVQVGPTGHVPGAEVCKYSSTTMPPSSASISSPACSASSVLGAMPTATSTVSAIHFRPVVSVTSTPRSTRSSDATCTP